MDIGSVKSRIRRRHKTISTTNRYTVIGVLELNKEIKTQLIKNNKAYWFINHIKKHLKKDDKVMCTICCKTVDEIAEETLEGILLSLDKSVGG